MAEDQYKSLMLALSGPNATGALPGSKLARRSPGMAQATSYDAIAKALGKDARSSKPVHSIYGALSRPLAGIGQGLYASSAVEERERYADQLAQQQAQKQAQASGTVSKPKYMNIGGKLVKIEGGEASAVDLGDDDPEAQIMNVGGRVLSITPGQDPQVLYEPKPDPIDQMINNALSGGGAPQPPQQGLLQQNLPGEGGIQPNDPALRKSSADIPAGDPNLIQTTGQAPQGQPQQDMVNIPGLGQMPRERAEKMATALTLKGRDDAAAIFNKALGTGAGDIGKAGSNEIDKQIINTTNALARMQEIRRTFKPEYQVIETKLGMEWGNFKDKIGFLRESITPEDRKALNDYYTFRVTSIDNINRYIKEITGAQMSEAEAKRLRQGVPDAGDGVFSGDGPEKFMSKLTQTERTLQLAGARYAYMKKNGFNGTTEELASQMPLQKMENLINERAEAYFQKASERGLPPDKVQGFVKQQLQNEFGIAI